jgi:cytochrome c-type biogenesis protein CcmE
MRPRLRLLLLVLVVPTGLAFTLFLFSRQSAVYYYTMDQVLTAKPQRPVRIGARVVPGSIQREPEGFLVRFAIHDHTSPESLKVVYRGVPADPFAEDREVVVTGKVDWATGEMIATDLLVKCPSKYEKQMEGTPAKAAADTGKA